MSKTKGTKVSLETALDVAERLLFPDGDHSKLAKDPSPEPLIALEGGPPLIEGLPEGAAVLLCSKGTKPPRVEGAKIGGVCFKCKQPVWVSKSSIRVLEDGAIPVCLDCALAGGKR